MVKTAEDVPQSVSDFLLEREKRAASLFALTKRQQIP
jgi:hypothetical protein